MARIWSDEEKQEVETTAEESLNDSMDSFKEYGLTAWVSDVSFWGSVYINVSDGKDVLFRIRLSDHILPESCIRPPGVLDYDLWSISGIFFITSDEVKEALEIFNSMSKEDKEFLWK